MVFTLVYFKQSLVSSLKELSSFLSLAQKAKKLLKSLHFMSDHSTSEKVILLALLVKQYLNNI